MHEAAPDPHDFDMHKLDRLRERFHNGTLAGEGSSVLSKHERSALQNWARRERNSDAVVNAGEQIAPDSVEEARQAVDAALRQVRTECAAANSQAQSERTQPRETAGRRSYFERISEPVSSKGKPAESEQVMILANYDYREAHSSEASARIIRVLHGENPYSDTSPSVSVEHGKKLYLIDTVTTTADGQKITIQEFPSPLQLLKRTGRDIANAFRTMVGKQPVPHNPHWLSFEVTQLSAGESFTVDVQSYRQVNGRTEQQQAAYRLDERNAVCLSSPQRDATPDANLELLAKTKEALTFNVSEYMQYLYLS